MRRKLYAHVKCALIGEPICLSVAVDTSQYQPVPAKEGNHGLVRMIQLYIYLFVYLLMGFNAHMDPLFLHILRAKSQTIFVPLFP